MHDAVRAFERASREPYGRSAPWTRAGGELRMAAVRVALIAAAGRDDGAAFVALVFSRARLVDAVAELRATQERAAQAAAARADGEPCSEPVRRVAGPPLGADRPLLPVSGAPLSPTDRLSFLVQTGAGSRDGVPKAVQESRPVMRDPAAARPTCRQVERSGGPSISRYRDCSLVSSASAAGPGGGSRRGRGPGRRRQPVSVTAASAYTPSQQT